MSDRLDEAVDHAVIALSGSNNCEMCRQNSLRISFTIHPTLCVEPCHISSHISPQSMKGTVAASSTTSVSGHKGKIASSLRCCHSTRASSVCRQASPRTVPRVLAVGSDRCPDGSNHFVPSLLTCPLMATMAGIQERLFQ